MVTHFTEKYTDEVVDYLKQIWRDDCKAEESFSVAKFKEKESFFLNNTESVEVERGRNKQSGEK